MRRSKQAQKRVRTMGIRSQNYIALKQGISLSHAMKLVGEGADVLSNHGGTLIVYESNFTPMWARDGKGEACVFDLEEEMSVHRFLGSLDPQDFLMKRVGEEFGSRGKWTSHPFGENHDVQSIEQAHERAKQIERADEDLVEPVMG